jgi:DNA-nicking Smr family endonuclease
VFTGSLLTPAFFTLFYLNSSPGERIILKWVLRKIMSDVDPVRIPIDGVLDLHAFRAEEVKNLVPEYLEECRKQGIHQVRIIHGKGTGALRRTVQSLLRKNPHVLKFKTADLGGGGWGATEVMLKE